jgi:1,4-dihydroxy-2-naphthoyl-CoA hydrolase
MAAEPSQPPVEGFDALLGMRVLECRDDVVRAEVAVRDELRQPFGLVHGGVFAAIAEALASRGTLAAVGPEGSAPMGMSNSTSFLRPVSEGTIHGHAVRRHRGRTTWVWDVEMTDDDGRLCAITRMTIAVRPRPSRGSGS